MESLVKIPGLWEFFSILHYLCAFSKCIEGTFSRERFHVERFSVISTNVYCDVYKFIGSCRDIFIKCVFWDYL